jgi:hypothetical protein
MKKLILELKSRWQTESPLFFKKVMKTSVFISGMALAMHLAMDSSGANEPTWWINIYPYLIAIPAGIAACAKLTKE